MAPPYLLWMWNVLKKFDYSHVAGHNLICKKLRHAVQTGRTVSAYLFTGTKGIGKKTVAEAFAASLLCESPWDGAPCKSCTACKLLASGSHPDLIRLKMPEDKKSIGVEVVREQIIQEAYVRPFHAERKVFLIENGEAMTDGAQNALLKILEEPPTYAVFIILSTSSDQMLETVRSRCLAMHFLPLSQAECHAYFEQFASVPRERRQLSASFSQGVIGKGLQMMEDDAYAALYRDTISHLTSLTKERDAVPSMQLFLTENRENIQNMIDFMLIFLRDCLRVSINNQTKLICTDQKEAVKLFRSSCSPSGLVRMMEAVIRFRERLLKNASFSVSGLELLIRMQEEIHD